MEIIEIDTTKPLSQFGRTEILDLENGIYSHFSDAFVVYIDEFGAQLITAVPLRKAYGHILCLRGTIPNQHPRIDFYQEDKVLRLKSSPNEDYGYLYRIRFVQG